MAETTRIPDDRRPQERVAMFERYSTRATVSAWIALVLCITTALYMMPIFVGMATIHAQVSTLGLEKLSMDIFPTYVMPFLLLLPIVVFLWVLGSLFIVFYAARQIMNIGKEIFFTKYYYSWGWTVVALFIPFWSFYRPWVGLAEIRKHGRAQKGDMSSLDVLTAWDKTTVILGVIVWIALLVSSIIVRMEEEVAHGMETQKGYLLTVLYMQWSSAVLALLAVALGTIIFFWVTSSLKNLDRSL